MKKVINIGTDNDTGSQVFCAVKYKDNKLSIVGVVGPMANGNARGSCGQIRDSFTIREFANGWDNALLTMFLTIWEKYHLNDMQAGTIKQTAIIEQHKENNPDWRYTYDGALAVLESKGLKDDNGYRYGSKWLSIEVPESVISFLESLPETERTPAWV